MKLTELTVNEYLDSLKSENPAPGGGSASALSGVQGMALLIMVIGLTVGKEKYAAFHDVCGKAREKALKLSDALTEAVDTDTEAFTLVANAYKMPKATEDEKLKRSEAVQAGMMTATEVPLSVMKLALAGLDVISTVLGKTNPSALSDLGVAVLSMWLCARGAYLNVRINLSGIKDEGKKEFYKEEAQKMIESVEKISTELYNKIVQEI